MDTHITGKCPQCGADFRLRAYAAGRRARCRSCKEVFVVPGRRQDKAVEDDVMSWLGSSSGKGRQEEVDLDGAEDQDEGEGDDEDDDQDADVSRMDASSGRANR